MHVCMYAWMHGCMCTCVYVYMYTVYIYIYMCVRVRICICLWLFMYIHVYTCIYICYVLYIVIRSAHTYTSMTLIDLGKNRCGTKRFKQRVRIILDLIIKITLDEFSGPNPWSSIQNCRLSMFVPQLPLSHGCFAVPVLPEGTAAEIRCSRAGSGVWALMQSGQTSQTVSQAEYYLFRQGNENQDISR